MRAIGSINANWHLFEGSKGHPTNSSALDVADNIGQWLLNTVIQIAQNSHGVAHRCIAQGVLVPKPEEKRRPLTLFISLASLFTTSLLGALASRQLAMHFGASTFGILALATSFAIAVQTLTEFGQFQVLQRELVQGKRDQAQLVSMALALRAAIMLVSLPAAYAIAWALYRNTDNAYSIIAIMLISVPIGSLNQVFYAYFADRFLNRQQAIYQVGQQALMLAGVSMLVAHHRPLIECAMVIVGSSFLLLLTMGAQVSRSVNLSLAFDREYASYFLREAASLGLSTLLLALYWRADILLLSIESTTKQVGYYGIVIAINSFFVMIPTVLTRSFMPLIADTDRSRWTKALRDLQTYAWALGFGSVVVIEIGASYVVDLFAGAQYEAAVTPLRIVCVALLASFIFPCLTALSVSRGIQRKLVRVTLAMLVLNVVVNVAVIPRFGISGCAWATVGSEFLGVLTILMVINRELDLRTRDYLRPMPALVAGIGSLAALWPVTHFRPTSLLEFCSSIGLAGLIFLVILTLLAGLPLTIQSIVVRDRNSRVLRWLGFRDPWVNVKH